MVIDSVVWAFKHTSRETGEVGLSILLALLENVAAPGLDVAQVSDLPVAARLHWRACARKRVKLPVCPSSRLPSALSMSSSASPLPPPLPRLLQVFYETYLLQLITDLLVVLTDRLHKAHFKQQCDVLRHMFQLVDTGAVTTPLWTCPLAVSSGAGAAYVSSLAAAAGGVAPPPTAYSNQGFVREFVRMWVAANFKNLTP